MRKAIIAAAIAATVALCGCSGNGIVRDKDAATLQTDDRFITDDMNDNFYTVVDSKTGVTYLKWERPSGKGGKVGGITVLVDEDGKPIISEEVESGR